MTHTQHTQVYNARLIAAAPELLTVCELLGKVCGIQANLQSTATDAERKKFIGMVFEIYNEIAIPAIAKARGQSC